MKNILRTLSRDALAAVFYASGLALFASEAGFAPGGLMGLVLIMKQFVAVPLGLLTLLMNIPLMLLAYRILGRQFILKTLQTVAIGSLFMDLIMPHLPHYHGDPLLAAIFAAALTGIGLAIVYQGGSSTGGTDLVLLSARKIRPHLSVGQITLAVDSCIICLGGLTFKNIDAVLYGFIYSVVLSLVVDKIMYGFSAGKMLLIITQEADQIAGQIGARIHRGCTLIPAEGGYTGSPQKLVLSACTKRQAVALRQLIQEIDPHAILIVTEYNEVYGQGFQSWLPGGGA